MGWWEHFDPQSGIKRSTLAASLCLVIMASACSTNTPVPGAGEPLVTTTSQSPGTTTTATTQTTAPAPATGSTAVRQPRYGGTLRYGLEADSLNPWTPADTAAAVSGHMVMRSVYDTLALPTIDLEVEGNLLEAIEPNADFTVWTLRVRPGITFHDGTPLDGAAVADNLQRNRVGALTASFLVDVADVTSEGMTVTVLTTRPWVSFPAVLTGQAGYVASPTWLAMVDGNPDLASQPVGTGPFVFESYTPGVSFTATRNTDYWREGLPYLDGVDLRVLRNIKDRSTALLDGDIDIIHTANGDEIAKFRDRLGAFDMVEAREFGETTYVLLNVGNPASPVSDLRVRRAMAHALDYDIIKTARNGGIFEVPNGPFQPGSIGHLRDTGFPTYDPDLARELVDDWESENGPLEISFTTTSDEFNLISAELYEQFWEAAGIDVTLQTIDQSQYIGFALVGNFEAYFWRLHSGFDPDEQLRWWLSDNARDFGTPSTNFGRIRDEVLDGHLATIRTAADPEARRRAAEEVNRRFADQVYNIWLGWPVTGIIFDPTVKQVNTGFTLPSGASVLPTGVGIGGTHQLAQIWIDR